MLAAGAEPRLPDGYQHQRPGVQHPGVLRAKSYSVHRSEAKKYVDTRRALMPRVPATLHQPLFPTRLACSAPPCWSPPRFSLSSPGPVNLPALESLRFPR